MGILQWNKLLAMDAVGLSSVVWVGRLDFRLAPHAGYERLIAPSPVSVFGASGLVRWKLSAVGLGAPCLASWPCETKAHVRHCWI